MTEPTIEVMTDDVIAFYRGYGPYNIRICIEGAQATYYDYGLRVIQNAPHVADAVKLWCDMYPYAGLNIVEFLEKTLGAI